MPQLYKVKNFSTFTLLAPGGTGIGTGLVTVNESLSGFTATFPLRAEIYDSDATFSSTKEIIELNSVNTLTNQFNMSARGQEGTVAATHPTGAKLRLTITQDVINNMIDEINNRALQSSLNTTNTNITNLTTQGNIPVTAVITSGEAYPATVTANGVTGPTLLYLNPTDQRYYRASGSLALFSYLDNLALAFEASTGAGESHRVYLPGSIVSGFTGLSLATPAYYPDTGTPGGLNTVQGTFWVDVIRPLSATTAFFIDSGRNNLNYSNAGSAGTSSFNNGTSNFAARYDHEHKIYYEFCPILISPVVGQTTKWFANKTPLTYDIDSFYAVTDGAVSSASNTYIRLEKTSQADIDSTASGWTTMFSSDPYIAINQRSSTSSGGGVFSSTTLAPGEHLRARITTLGAGIGDISIVVVMKLKNTN